MMRKRFFQNPVKVSTVIAMALIVLQGCIGTDKFEGLAEGNEQLELISPNGQTALDSIFVNETIQYTGRYLDAASQEQDIALTWSSSNPDVASVDDQGIATGLTEGTSMIRVEGNGLSAERLIWVSVVERVEVSAAQTFLLVGDQLAASASYYNPNGEVETATFTWVSSDPGIATVDANGNIDGLSEGQVEITASANGLVSAPLVLSVLGNANQVATVTITAASTSVLEGDQVSFAATVTNANGDPVSGAAITWNSSNNTVLSINSQGVATGVGLGLSSVTATVDGVTSNAIEILVQPAVVTSRTGNFTGLSGYNVNGTVTVEANGNDLVLNFGPDFSTNNGPGLYINMSNSTSGGVTVGSLPSTSGPFTMTLPNTGLNDFNNVLVYCQPFGVTFGRATLN